MKSCYSGNVLAWFQKYKPERIFKRFQLETNKSSYEIYEHSRQASSPSFLAGAGNLNFQMRREEFCADSNSFIYNFFIRLESSDGKVFTFFFAGKGGWNL